MIQDRRIRDIELKNDGSIRNDDGTFAVEFTCLFLKDDRSNLKQLCDLLSEVGAQVNKSCGLHVHLDCRDTTRPLTRAKRLGNALPVLCLMVPHSRLESQYCRPAVSGRRGSRYFAVNCTALRKFNTIEVRLHSGTVDFNKISNWVDLLYMVSRASTLSKQRCTTYPELSGALPRATNELMFYVRSRIQQFNRGLDVNTVNRLEAMGA